MKMYCLALVLAGDEGNTRGDALGRLCTPESFSGIALSCHALHLSVRTVAARVSSGGCLSILVSRGFESRRKKQRKHDILVLEHIVGGRRLQSGS